MKKQFIIGIILSCSILLITPSLPAMEFAVVQDAYQNLAQNENKILSLESKVLFQNTEQQKNKKISPLSLINIFNKNQIKSYSLISQDNEEANDSLWFLFLLIVYFVLYLIFKGIPNFIKTLVSLIITMANNISLFIVDLLVLIFNIIVFIVYSFGQLLVKLWQGLGTIIDLILDILRLFYEVLFPNSI
jgi:hypothetical protein